MAALSRLKPGEVLTELPIQALVNYDATMRKGNSLDNNPAKAVLLRRSCDIWVT